MLDMANGKTYKPTGQVATISAVLFHHVVRQDYVFQKLRSSLCSSQGWWLTVYGAVLSWRVTS